MFLNYILTSLAPLFGGGNFFVNGKISNGQFFSKDYTTMLKGICCIIVVYVHFKGKQTNALQDAIGSFAFVAVSLFFLISAYGMMLSVEKKKGYLTHFWRNRLVSLLVPCICVNIVGLILSGITGNIEYGIIYYINGYVIVLLQFCLWFYMVECCKQKWFVRNTFGSSDISSDILTKQ